MRLPFEPGERRGFALLAILLVLLTTYGLERVNRSVHVASEGAK